MCIRDRTCIVYFGLNLFLDATRHNFTRAAQAAFIGQAVACRIDVGSYVVRVDAHDLTKSCIALQGEVFLVIVYVKNGLRSIYHSPDDSDANFNRIT